jgi:uncharacterized protein YgiM (DUF1202 family)
LIRSNRIRKKEKLMKKKLHVRIQTLVLVLLLALGTFVIAPEQALADTEVVTDEEIPQVATYEEVTDEEMPQVATYEEVTDEEMPQVATYEEVIPDVSVTEDQNDVELPVNEAVSETDTDITDEPQEMPAVADNPDDQDDDLAVPDNAEYSRSTRDYTPEGDFSFDPGTGTITGYSGASKNVNIPPSMNSVDVKHIGDSAFEFKNLESVTIPEGVTMIGIEAFANNDLTYVKIPDSVESIGQYAFRGNPMILAAIPDDIRSIVLGAGVITDPTIENIGLYCFDVGTYLNTFYIEANYNILATPNGAVITKLWRPLYVTGTNVVNNNNNYWLEFTYNGNPAYVTKVATIKNSPEITGYATGILNLRDEPGGSIIDTIPMGYEVNGLLVKNMVETTYNGKTGYVYASLLQKDPVQVTRYIKTGSNIRSTPGGAIIETLKMPIYVTGIIEGSYLKFTYNGKTAYVHLGVTTTQSQPITGYVKSKVNVRSSPNGGVIGSLSIGSKVSGTLTGNWVRFTYAGKTGYVYSSLLQADPVNLTCYVKAGSNIRSAPGGTIITTLKMPIFVTGTIQGSYLKFIYNGKAAYVAIGLTTTTSPPITGYTKSAVNVRSSPGGSVIGSLPANRKVSGTLVGNWVKFTYSGKTGYIYALLLK